MRTFWLRDTLTKNVWNLTPDDPYSVRGGCALTEVKGLGYENEIKQTQAKLDYFIDNVSSKNVQISGVLHFNGDKHVDNFYDFVRDFSRTFEFHYSPDGRIIASDQISPSWYKPCTISKIEKAEKNGTLWYDVPFTITTHSDVWRREVSIVANLPEEIGDALVYPYFYSYYYGGETALAVDIRNIGRETYPIIKITNKSEGAIESPGWISEYIYTDLYGNLVSEPQRARFNIKLHRNNALLVDSRALVNGVSAQRAAVVSENGGIENVVNNQEADFDYINFISLIKGQNRVIFLLGGETNVDIQIKFEEQREII